MFTANPPPPRATSSPAEVGAEDVFSSTSALAVNTDRGWDSSPAPVPPIHASDTPTSRSPPSLTPAAMRSASPAAVALTSRTNARSNEATALKATVEDPAHADLTLRPKPEAVRSAAISSPSSPNPPVRSSDDWTRAEIRSIATLTDQSGPDVSP